MPKKFNFRLESVLSYYQTAEENKKIEFVMAKKELNLAKQKKDEMERNLVLTNESKKECLKGDFDFDLVNMYNNYINRIEHDIEKQQEVIEKKKKEFKEKKQEYIKWRKKKRSLEILKEKSFNKYMEEIETQQQKFNDEISIIRHRRENEETS